MVIAGFMPGPAVRWVLGVLLLASPVTACGQSLEAPSRGEDNRTERGNEALTGEGAWAGTLTPPVALSATQPQSQASPRSKVATAAKKPRQRVKRTAAARRARPEPTHSSLNFNQIRKAVFAPFSGH